MAKLIKLSIDLAKIDEAGITKTEKGGKYINCDLWINDEADKYGNTAGLKQSVKAADGTYSSHYIGNGKPVTKKQDSGVQDATVIDGLPF